MVPGPGCSIPPAGTRRLYPRIPVAVCTLLGAPRWHGVPGPTSARPAVGPGNTLGSEASLGLGDDPPRNNSAQSCLRSSGSKTKHYARAKSGNGERLDSDRVNAPLIALVQESDGRRPIPDIPRCCYARASKRTTFVTFADLREKPE